MSDEYSSDPWFLRQMIGPRASNDDEQAMDEMQQQPNNASYPRGIWRSSDNAYVVPNADRKFRPNIVESFEIGDAYNKFASDADAFFDKENPTLWITLIIQIIILVIVIYLTAKVAK